MMRTLLVAGWLVSLPALAWGQAPKAVIESAIEAHGGKEALARARLCFRSGKGEITSFGARAAASLELLFQAPDKARWTFEIDAGAQKVPVVIAMADGKGFRFSGGAMNPLNKQELEDPLLDLHLLNVATLLPLMEDGFTLAALPEIKVNDAPALGVKVAAKGKPEIKLYFDKKTNLLVKADRPGKEGGIDVTREYVWSDHKDFERVKLPGKQLELLNGRKVAEWTISGYKFPPRVDEAMFTKP